jgi:hypothetical protein
MTDSTFKTTTLAAHDAASNAKGETNDCTVRALAAASGASYEEAHAALAKHGRPYRKGPTATWIYSHGRRYIDCPALRKAALDLGCSWKVLEPTEYKAKTMTTAARDRHLASGRFICMVRGHVAALVDGEVIDWTAGRRHQIKEVYKLVPGANAKAEPKTREPMKAMSLFDQGSLF